MRRAALLALTALVLAILASPREIVTPSMSDALPPYRFQQDARVVTVYAAQREIDRRCGKSTVPGVVRIACKRSRLFGGSVLYLPNPCPWGHSETYARWTCHELGHANGWTAEHES